MNSADSKPFFDQCAPYLEHIQFNRFAVAVDAGLEFLKQVRNFSPKEYQDNPKGTPFFWLGVAAYLSHDFQTAAFLFDAAVSEDLKFNPARDDAPALLTMQLKPPTSTNTKHIAEPIVNIVIAKLQHEIRDYSSRSGNVVLSIDDLRESFLSHFLRSSRSHLRTLTTTFISYFFEWDYRSKLIEVQEAGSREPFFRHLFRGCLLFESILKENPRKNASNETTLNKTLKFLHSELGIPNRIKTGSNSFDSIASSIKNSDPINLVIEHTAQIRNTLGHSLGWPAPSLNEASYNLLSRNIAISCLHAIACLYK
jgi:hypothetical protein